MVNEMIFCFGVRRSERNFILTFVELNSFSTQFRNSVARFMSGCLLESLSEAAHSSACSSVHVWFYAIKLVSMGGKWLRRPESNTVTDVFTAVAWTEPDVRREHKVSGGKAEHLLPNEIGMFYINEWEVNTANVLVRFTLQALVQQRGLFRQIHEKERSNLLSCSSNFKSMSFF